MKSFRLIAVFAILVGLFSACQKDQTSVINDKDLIVGSSRQLKSTPNTANLDQLLLIIAEKVQNGEISKGHGTALIVKINSAIKSIQKGQLKAAENVLNAFINQVNTFVADGVLSSETGNLLATKANEVFNPPSWKCGDNFTDSRDGRSYKSVQIGGQCWMGENLNSGKMLQCPEVPTNNQIIEKYCQNWDLANCETYGGLYTWDEAMDYTNSQGSRGICPEGWHIPTGNDWVTLQNFLGGMYEAGYKLKSSTGWVCDDCGGRDGNGNNESGFDALPSGVARPLCQFSYLGEWTYFWTSSEEYWGANAQDYFVGNGHNILDYAYDSKEMRVSVRCIKD